MKKVLITGTSRGIGQEIVRQLLEKTDFYIFATMRQPHGPRRPQQETDRMTVLALDVAEAGSIAILAKDLLALGVKLDAIVFQCLQCFQRSTQHAGALLA
ncbi:MAG: SDR family NAD(P)-dependent oxidoreductase [Spirochaetales bacterium]|nr:SDR family NAD(P)-dependent oxidoreductase [Spirochaetales bacterium]